MTIRVRPAYVARVQQARLIAAVRNLGREQAAYELQHEVFAVMAGLALTHEPAPCQWQDDYIAELGILAGGILAYRYGDN